MKRLIRIAFASTRTFEPSPSTHSTQLISVVIVIGYASMISIFSGTLQELWRLYDPDRVQAAFRAGLEYGDILALCSSPVGDIRCISFGKHKTQIII
jgi:hypothetical protein